MTTLTEIRSKVRKVTGSPSANQLSDSDIDTYINTFYLYDFPEHLRLLKLKKVYTFFTEPLIEKYDFPDEPFFTVEPPIYVGGYQARYLQDRDTFFLRWPPLNQFQQIGTGDGTSSPALQQITAVPIMRESLYISGISGGETITYNDDGKGQFISERFDISQINNANPATVTCLGHPFVVGQKVLISSVIGMLNINLPTPYDIVATMPGVSFDIMLNTTNFPDYTGGGFANRVLAGTVSYTTGVITLDWGVTLDVGSQIQAQFIFYTAGRPYDVLFYDTQFHFRPVPDKSYKVEINCFVQPTALLDTPTANFPELREWWQLLAYGASLKVFADRADFENLQAFEALMEEQKILVQRRTLKQLTNQRTSTIYANQQLWPQSNFYPYS